MTSNLDHLLSLVVNTVIIFRKRYNSNNTNMSYLKSSETIISIQLLLDKTVFGVGEELHTSKHFSIDCVPLPSYVHVSYYLSHIRITSLLICNNFKYKFQFGIYLCRLWYYERISNVFTNDFSSILASQCKFVWLYLFIRVAQWSSCLSIQPLSLY